MISTIEKLALKTNAKIAIGVGTDKRLSGRTIAGAMQSKIKKFANPVLVSREISSQLDIETIITKTPEKELLTLLKTNKVDAIVRGSLQAADMIKIIQQGLTIISKEEITGNRLALIENPIAGHSFFLSPVGIEEGHTLNDKAKIISQGIKLLSLLDIEPNIAVLAAGIRETDLGRHHLADQTIDDAEFLLNKFSNESKISTPGILIEQAIDNRKNLIIAMDGISGNLLYRTLVHVGSHQSYGAALLLPQKNGQNYVYIDTSHRGTVHDYQRAIMFASALVGSVKSK